MYPQEQKLQNMKQSSFLYQFLKKLIQIAISLSVFSFLFLHPYWPLFHSFISHLSTFTSQLSSLATDKNYIFILCNGILVFIAKYSSHTADTHPPTLPETSPDNDLIYKAYRQSMQSSMEKSVLVEDVVATNDDENENNREMNEVIQEDVEDKHVLYQVTDGTVQEEDGAIADDEDKVYMKENFDCWSCEEQQDDNEAEAEEAEEEKDEQQQEQEKEEEIAKMSTEELNRKFDDFIRKMKEELRVEAQQLIVV